MRHQPDKALVRASMLAARRERSPAARAADDAAIVARLAEVARGCQRVAGFVPMAGEPGGPGLLTALVAAVPALLLPVLRADRDLDWARYDGSLVAGRLAGLAEPAGPRLGPTAVTGVDLVLVPAVAVDLTGTRLGRGGGSYDRALARVEPGTPVVAVLYETELVASLPAQPHDRPVTAVLTPAGLTRLGPAAGGSGSPMV